VTGCCQAFCASLGHGIGAVFILFAIVLFIWACFIIESPNFLISWSYARFQSYIFWFPLKMFYQFALLCPTLKVLKYGRWWKEREIATTTAAEVELVPKQP
jgi:hypothetical protein